MVFIRSLLPLAALATAVLAAPAAHVRDLAVNSGGSDCSGSNCGGGSESSGCSGSDCGSSDSSSSSMSMSMDCSGDSCGSSSSSTASADCSGDSCGSSQTMSMDCGSGGCGGESSSTSTAAYSMATYGSGSSNWGQYEDCVQQCIAEFGGDSSSSSGGSSSQGSSGDSSSGDSQDVTPTATMGSGGTNGATHTIIVAPTKGVLRMVPFATEAAVGDTIEFIWHADQHTVTKGSALQLCNQSADASTFDTGLQNHSFSYLQVVNDTNPLYYYCAHPGHCQNGMFGVINPLTTDDPALQAGSAQNETMGDSTMAAMAYTQGAIANGTSADANNLAKVWGAKYSLKDIPAEMHGAFMENMLYVRSLIAMNPDLVQDGKLKMSTAGAPVMWPMDVAGASAVAAKAQLAVAPGAAPAGAAAAAPASSSDAAPAATTTAAKKNGARGLAASGVTVALGLFVSFLAL